MALVICPLALSLLVFYLSTCLSLSFHCGMMLLSGSVLERPVHSRNSVISCRYEVKIVQNKDSLVLFSMKLKYSRLLLTFSYNIDLYHISEFVFIFLYENLTLGVGDS